MELRAVEQQEGEPLIQRERREEKEAPTRTSETVLCTVLWYVTSISMTLYVRRSPPRPLCTRDGRAAAMMPVRIDAYARPDAYC